MANRAYLCSSPIDTLYPSLAQGDYDSDVQTLASDVYCVPFLWLCLFRPEDLRSQEFQVEGKTIIGRAPITTLPRALAALDRSRPLMTECFRRHELGDFDPYFELFRSAVVAAPYEFISIELDEIAHLYQEQEFFYSELRDALAEMDSSPSEAQIGRLFNLAEVRHEADFPPARLLLDNLQAEDDEFWNHCRAMGAGRTETGIGRLVPWET